jgi:hypothetical protein
MSECGHRWPYDDDDDDDETINDDVKEGHDNHILFG